jgi:hypothetical protein
MNWNVMLALLAHLKLVDEDKAKELAKKLNNSISPARYEDAVQVVREILDK